MTRRTLLAGLLLVTPQLAACGRQGDLRLPEQTPPRERQVEPDAEAEEDRS
jgi:predicted small lipoprotein YifL